MKKICLLVSVLILLIFSACHQQAEKVDLDKEIGAIKLVLEKYVLANENQDMGLIEDIWYPSESIVSFGTNSDEKLIGFAAIKKTVQQQFNSFTKTYINCSDQIIELNDNGNTAWFSEILSYNFILNNEAQSFEGIRYTGVLVKIDGKWKLVQTHMSIPANPETN